MFARPRPPLPLSLDVPRYLSSLVAVSPSPTLAATFMRATSRSPPYRRSFSCRVVLSLEPRRSPRPGARLLTCFTWSAMAMSYTDHCSCDLDKTLSSGLPHIRVRVHCTNLPNRDRVWTAGDGDPARSPVRSPGASLRAPPSTRRPFVVVDMHGERSN